MTSKFLIFGAGYSGKAFATATGPSTAISGTTRSADKAAALRSLGIKPFIFDGGNLCAELKAELRQATDMIVSIAPDEDGDPVLAVLPEQLATIAPTLRWIGYLSTVGVYGDHDGDWIDETGECRPGSKRSMQRLAAENAWLELGERTGLPVAVLRLSGIYGPGRNALVNLTNGTARRMVKPGQVFNRVHVDDIAGALRHLCANGMGGVFNVTDDLPAPPQDVVVYAAGLMGMEPPPEIPFATAQLSPMARSFYSENKRVSNGRIKAAGYRFRYPDYRSAFDAMWKDEAWKGVGQADARSPIKRF